MERDSTSRPSSAAQPITLMRVPNEDFQECRDSRLLEEACPRRVPRTSAEPYRAYGFGSPRDGYRIFSFEWGGPYPGLTKRNRPPRMVHVVVVGGRVGRALPFMPWRGGIHAGQREPVLLAWPRWADRDGTLGLAPTYPAGGIHGDHLFFRWKSAGRKYLVSLHAWRPIREVRRTLRLVVESIPKR
jgi:hypothetical protein